MFLLGLFLSSPAMAQKETWRANVPKPGPARDIELGEYSSFDLRNGLKVIVVENHKIPRLSYQLSLQHKPIPEGKKVGYRSMAGSLLKTGTKNRSKAQIDEEIDFIGASLNTFARGMYGSSLKKHSGKLLDIFTDVLYNPSFPQEEFDKYIKQARSGLASAKTSPESMVSNTASVLNFGSKHPYGEIQQEKHLDAMTLQTLKNYYKTFFRPNNAYLIIVGDITPAEAKKTAKKYFGKWKKGYVPEYKSEYIDAPSKNRVALINKDGAVQSVIRVTYPIDLKPGDEDVLKARVMNSALGGGVFSGRLMQNLREDKAYTYGARSSINANQTRGSFAAYASVRNEVTDSSVQEFMYELRRMSTEPISKSDLAKIKASLAGSFARSLESPQTIARFAMNTFKYDLPKDYYNTYLQRLDAITIDDVNEMVAKYIRPENANIVIAGAAGDIADKLVRFDGDGVIEYFDAFGNPTEKPSNDAGGASLEGVMGNYFKALGGKDKLQAVKLLHTAASMEMMGQKMNISNYQGNDKMAMNITMGGNVVQSIKYDGKKVTMGGMAGSKEITDEAQVKEFANQAIIFPELNFNEDTFSIAGKESVDGKDAYKVLIKSGQGSKVNYYDMASGLLVKSVSSLPTGQQQVTLYKDYKEVNGILFPHKMSVEGMMPTAVDMIVDKIEINPTPPKGTF